MRAGGDGISVGRSPGKPAKVRWTIWDELLQMSRVFKRTIAGFKAGETQSMWMNLGAVRRTLEKLGVETTEGKV